MSYRFPLSKMRTRHASPVEYSLALPDGQLELNDLIGRSIQIRFLNLIQCVECGRKTKKSFNQGYCYPCFRSKAACDRCIMSPELCHFAEGTCREPDWAEQHCMQPHVVYLANASGVKVGITRGTQVPTRWMDQGAIQALPVMTVDNRRDSGLVESTLKAHVSDRTDWRRMLKNDVDTVDLKEAFNSLLARMNVDINGLREMSGAASLKIDQNASEYSFEYPVRQYQQKVSTLNLDKTPEVTGELQGIKGQYLILDSGVLNVRKFSGYQVEMEIS